MVAMQATWSHPVSEAVEFSNDFARRRERPRRPCATSTRQACRMGRKTGCLSSHPTLRTSISVAAERAGGCRGDTAVQQDQLEPVGDALAGQMPQHQLAGRFSWVEAGTTRAPTGRPVTSTATTRLAPLVRP